MEALGLFIENNYSLEIPRPTIAHLCKEILKEKTIICNNTISDVTNLKSILTSISFIDTTPPKNLPNDANSLNNNISYLVQESCNKFKDAKSQILTKQHEIDIMIEVDKIMQKCSVGVIKINSFPNNKVESLFRLLVLGMFYDNMIEIHQPFMADTNNYFVFNILVNMVFEDYDRVKEDISVYPFQISYDILKSIINFITWQIDDVKNIEQLSGLKTLHMVLFSILKFFADEIKIYNTVDTFLRYEKGFCNICFDQDVDIVATKCYHTFCDTCILKWMKTKAPNHKCPVCRQAFI